jgi:regulator of CtrA degradation
MFEQRMTSATPQEQTASRDAISIAERMLSSEGFKALFRDGMTLVEDTATYLDGQGREDVRQLERTGALSYASESMRLTTRLMQMTSWLLLQRAVNEGELTRAEADAEHRKVSIGAQNVLPLAEKAGALPAMLLELIERSTRLQERISRLDQQLRADADQEPGINAVAEQMDMLRNALKR